MQASLRCAHAPGAARARFSQRRNVVVSVQQPQQQRGIGAVNSAARTGKRAALVAAALSAGALVQPQAIVQTALGGGGGGGGLGGNGGGWGGDFGWSRYFGVQPALAFKDEEDELFADDDKSGRGPVAQDPAATTAEDEQTFICESVKAMNLPTGPGIPTQVRRLAV